MDRASWRLVASLLAEQRFAALATQDGAAPYTSLVAFAVSPDLRQMVFPTRAGTRKFAHLEANPQVALLVDNRTNSARDYQEAAALTVLGHVRLQHGPESVKRRDLLLARHPLLAGFLAETDCRIASVEIAEYRLVTRFETTVRLEPAAFCRSAASNSAPSTD